MAEAARVMPMKPMSRQGIRARLETRRETHAEMMRAVMHLQQRLHAELAIDDELWMATQPDEPPEFDPMPPMRAVRPE